MNLGLDAFEDELLGLTKVALKKGTVLRYVGRKASTPKGALSMLAGASIVIPGILAGAQGYKRGRRMGRGPRFLHASRHGPSRAFWTNYSRQLKTKKRSRVERRRMSENELSDKTLKR